MKRILKFIVVICIWLGIINIIVYGSHIAKQKEKIVLEETINKSLMRCYILEGRYPMDLEYIKNNYNIKTDSKYYNIYYEAFADNIMPEVQVFECR